MRPRCRKSRAISVEEYQEGLLLCLPSFKTVDSNRLKRRHAACKTPHPDLYGTHLLNTISHLCYTQGFDLPITDTLIGPSASTMVRFTSLMLFGAAAVSASPLVARQATTVAVTADPAAATSTAWDVGAVHQYPIHASCNASQHQYIRNGLDEAMTISRQARDHILRWGNSSAIYQKYFGNASTGEPIGWFTKVVDGDKNGVIFRCDDPDQNCATQDSEFSITSSSSP
jgi:hypothetical protein